MNLFFFNKEIKKLNLDFLSTKLRGFIPEIKGDFYKEKKIFSTFWLELIREKRLLIDKKAISKNNINDINEFCNITKKIFLNKYAPYIYREITKDLTKYIRVDDLCYLTNDVVENLIPSIAEIELENKLFLKDKEGLEIQQGIFLSALLQNKIEGLHLCKTMLLPTEYSKEKVDEFEQKGKVVLDGARVDRKEGYDLVILDNPEYLNAEDNRTLLPLEIAIDIAIQSRQNNVVVFRGCKVNHPKYKNKNIFGAGINLTHLYEGKIPFLWYITRDMGAVNKVLRGHSNLNTNLESALFPQPNKIWFACLETFAIGGGCQYLLVMDYVIADNESFMTLPARKEGIIPGAANLRLWRYVGNRTARQAIQHGLKIKSDSDNGKKICDELINNTNMDYVVNNRIKEFNNSGVIGAAFNKRALTLGEESINQFREYMSIYCHDQAYCHFSNDLVNNLEKYWYNTKSKN